MTKTLTDKRTTEEKAVEEWRTGRALALGYPRYYAEEIAASKADLHDLKRMIRQGCDLMLAWEILR